MVGIHEEHKKISISNKRLMIVFFLQIFFFIILISRLFFLQITSYDKYLSMSEDNRIKMFSIPPLRGHILDRNNINLTENQKKYRVFLYRNKKDIKDEEILSKLSEVLNLSDKEYAKIYDRVKKNSNRNIVTIFDNADWEDLEKIKANSYNLDGVTIEDGYIRYYPYSSTFSHLIGYVNNPTSHEINKEKDEKIKSFLLHPDYMIGKNGLEKIFNKDITGNSGFKKVEVNAISLPIREIEIKSSTEGEDLKLTIDFNLQTFIEKRMKNTNGSVIVMDVITGEILALVSTPSYDSNKFVEGVSVEYWEELRDNKDNPLLNKTISQIYPPGSTFKPIVAISALESGWDDEEIVDCKGKIALNKVRTLHCWVEMGHGELNLVEAIRNSCNIYFTKIGLDTGIERIYKTARDFGFGEDFKINLLNKKKGIIPNKAWKKRVFNDVWVYGDTANVAMGQGFLSVTPLELAVMTTRIANDGYKVKPYLISGSEIVEENKKAFDEEPIAKKENIDIVKEGMYQVVNSKKGTAYWARIREKGFEMAGKTGTAQVIAREKKEILEEGEKELEKKFENHALFIGYAPYDKPKYAIVVVAEHGRGGSISAAPIARDILHYAQKNKIGANQDNIDSEILEKEDKK